MSGSYPSPTFSGLTVSSPISAPGLPPVPSTSIAGQYLRVNASGQAIEARTNLQTTSDINYQVYANTGPLSGAISRPVADKLTDLVTPKDFGAVADNNAIDNTDAFLNFFLTVGNGITGYIPSGIYNIESSIQITMPIYTQFTLFGACLDGAVLQWPNGQGLTITVIDQNSPIIIQGMSFWTGAASGVALTLVQSMTGITNPEYCGPTELVNLGFHDLNGWNPASNFFGTAILVSGLSNVSYHNINVAGATAPLYGSSGVGISIIGSSTAPSVAHNFYSNTFGGLKYGVNIGNYVQGVALDGCNFRGCSTGVYVPSGSNGTLNQLMAVNCQFNNNINAIVANSTVNASLLGNSISVPNGGSGFVATTTMGQNTIAGNQFLGTGGTQVGSGIVISGATSGTLITGNSFYNLSCGIDINTAVASHVNVLGNVYNNNGINTSPASTGTTGTISIGVVTA